MKYVVLLEMIQTIFSFDIKIEKFIYFYLLDSQFSISLRFALPLLFGVVRFHWHYHRKIDLSFHNDSCSFFLSER